MSHMLRHTQAFKNFIRTTQKSMEDFLCEITLLLTLAH